MQVKTFSGTSSQEVLAQVKAAMGPDAVILGNRSFRRNGVVCYEMTAGLERPMTEAAQPAMSAPAGTLADGSPMPSGWGEWHREWMQIKDQLFALMKPAIQLERLTPRQRVALEYLQREGVSDGVAVELYKRILAQPDLSVLECLGSMVPVKGWGPAHWGQRIHLMVGPFGFGKTSTGLRFALQLRQHEPEARIVFINADCLRGNGRLTLRHWAELSNFTYMEAPDASTMAQALQAAQNARAIFIDVPGLPRGQNLAQWRQQMGLNDIADMGEIATHLTLSPFCDALQTREFLQRYADRGPGSLVWTKLDEAVSFGSIVNVAFAAGRPISALSYGAELRDSLCAATETLVWRLIFKRQLPAQTGSGQ